MSKINGVALGLAVKDVLGPDTIRITLGPKHMAIKTELKHRITSEVTKSRFTYPRHLAENEIVIVVPDGTYAAAKVKIAQILTEMLTKLS